MELQDARDWIETIIANKIIVHPDRARQLYTDAEYEMPEHLKPKVMTMDELNMAEGYSDLLFFSKIHNYDDYPNDF